MATLQNLRLILPQSQRRSSEADVTALTMRKFAEQYLDLYPELLDLVSHDAAAEQK